MGLLAKKSNIACVIVLHSILMAGFMLSFTTVYADLPDTIERTLPGIVGVGTVQKTRRPPANLVGTGVAVGVQP